MKKNILHLIDTTGSGGAETVFIDLAVATSKSFNKTIAVIRDKGWLYEKLCENKIDTRIIDCKGSFNYNFLFTLVKLIKKEEITHIQSHLLGSNVYASMAGFITGVPVISTFHGVVDIDKKEKFKKLKLFLVKIGSKKVVSVSDNLYTVLLKHYSSMKRKTTIISNGIDASMFTNYNDELLFKNNNNIDDNKILIGSLGNIRPAKNYDLAIETISELKRQGLNLTYLIAGDCNNSLAKKLQEKVKLLRLEEDIIFLGFIDNVVEFLKSLDIFLMTSSTEGHPLALTQAMLAACPIVSTPSGVELILKNDENAVITRSHSSTELADTILNLEKKLDYKEKIRNNACSYAKEHYDINKTIEKYFKLYLDK